MRMVDLIASKRDGGELSTEAIQWFVKGVAAGTVPDYQAAALLMAIYLRGMSRRETVDLTLAMTHSGEQLDLHDTVPFTIDKHSSGGVGDKTTLVVQPLVAACGVPVGKMSGRGLGSSGGTLDKMESVRGWHCDLSMPQFKQQLREIGLVLAGQTADLAPADGKLYALRDVTGTVASMPLIAASIMSKKLAAGADAILLDVKVGSGAFMKTVPAARELAEIMVNIGHDAGRQTVALLSDMNQPLGHAIGNALELKEAITTLHGDGPPDFWAHCREVAAQMLLLAEKAETLAQAQEQIDQARVSGRAWHKFRQMVIAQGGDVSQIDEPDTLPQARYVETVCAPQDGFAAAFDTDALGWCTVYLGAGRLVKTDTLDHAVGLLLPLKVGDRVTKGQPIAVIHANDLNKLAQAKTNLLATITWTNDPVPGLPHFYGTVA